MLGSLPLGFSAKWVTAVHCIVPGSVANVNPELSNLGACQWGGSQVFSAGGACSTGCGTVYTWELTSGVSAK